MSIQKRDYEKEATNAFSDAFSKQVIEALNKDNLAQKEEEKGFGVNIQNKNEICQMKREHLNADYSKSCSAKSLIAPSIIYEQEGFQAQVGVENVGVKFVQNNEDKTFEAYSGLNKNIKNGEVEAIMGVKFKF